VEVGDVFNNPLIMPNRGIIFNEKVERFCAVGRKIAGFKTTIHIHVADDVGVYPLAVTPIYAGKRLDLQEQGKVRYGLDKKKRVRQYDTTVPVLKRL